MSDAVDFATAAITGAQTAANRDSVLVGAAYSNVRVGAGRRAKTTGADHGREYAQAHTGLLNKWNNSKAHRELTDFLCGLDAPSKNKLVAKPTTPLLLSFYISYLTVSHFLLPPAPRRPPEPAMPRV